jgi:thiol-disulfide isomerase/thioredoxin
MKKIILSGFFFFFYIVNFAQEFKAKIHPDNQYTWSILYQLQDFKNVYIENKQPDSTGVFKYNMQGKTPGEYIMLYDMNQQKKVFFIFNNEDIELEVFPDQNHKIEIIHSKENKIYLPFSGKRDYLVSVLDDFEKQLEEKKRLIYPDRAIFKDFKKKLLALQKNYIKKSEGLMANHLIKNSEEYYGDISLDADSYFNDKLTHYFDHFDINDPMVTKSHLLSDKVFKYILKIHPPTDPSTAKEEYLSRVKKVWHLIKDEKVKQDMILSLIQAFVNVNGQVSKALIENYYKQFPPEVRSKLNINNVLNDIGLLEGETAPDFEFTDLKNRYSLSNIKSDHILLIFWSATCPHCLKSMPKIQEFMKNKKDWKVVAIGLERGKSDWIKEHYFYPDFIHGVFINPENKWDQEIIKKYYIHSTPSFFILDKNKKIIAKPYEVEDVKKVVEQIERKN